ncbi:MAG TPA: L-fucose:H+ symporter permease [Terracidiphilus sp.]|nr:L-fucose:H+ symporter permease [Terracidiphilus sp.]
MHTAPTQTTSPQSSSAPLLPRTGKLAFFLVTGLFFLWAIPNNLNDVLIRQFMKSFEINRLEAGLVQSAFYFGYFLLAIPAALLMRRYGYKRGLLTGLLLYATGTFLFYSAAMARSYPLFLFALFVIASGLGFLETGSNPLVAQLGDPSTAVRRLNFSQAFNPLGSITGALIGTVFIFSGIEPSSGDIAHMKAQGLYDAFLKHETLRVLAPYMVLGVVVLLWALLIFRTQFPALEGDSSAANRHRSGGYLTLFRYPHFLSAIFAQFCYVGAQVGTWSYFIQYAQDYTHSPEKLAGYLLTTTLGAFAIGRFTSSYVMKHFRPDRMLAAFSIANILLLLVGILWTGWVGLIAVLLTSFFMSLMFPTIFALGIRDLGEHTKEGASLLVMAIIGGAVFTPLMGLAYQLTRSMAVSMIVPLLCYVVVGVFALAGAHAAPFPSRWERRLKHLVPVLGHRNWIVVADSAYPAQSSPGIETIFTGEDHLRLLGKVLQAISIHDHLRANIYTDAELKQVPENDAPGVTELRGELHRLLGPHTRVFDHDQIIARLDESAKLFNIVILKSTLAIPYTSVFLELDCGYWDPDAEKRLRNSLRDTTAVTSAR